MTTELEALISAAEQAAEAHMYAEALSIATDAVTRYPQEAQAWRLRSFVFALAGSYDQAVADLSSAIGIDPTGVYLFLDRGRYYLELQRWQAAVDDFGCGLDLCDEYDRETFLFLRAEGLLQLGRRFEALSDLANVPDDAKFWTYRFVRKVDLVAECERP
jgi:tetratricopeptide (TPR) repeat protein